MKSLNVSGEITYAASQYGRERDYWLNKLSGELVKSCFPYDFKRTNKNEYRKESVRFRFSEELFSKLMGISSKLDHRLYMFLVAGLVILLKKYTGNDDILLGTPIYKQDIEGDFINTVLVLRNQINDSMSFREVLLKKVRETVIEANENQNYPIETLLFQLDIEAPQDEFPLFDIAFLLENIHDKEYLQHTNPNIIFSFSRADNYLDGQLEYNALLYRKGTIERIIRNFMVVQEKVLSNIDIQVRHIDILSDEEKQQLFAFNDTKVEYPREKTIDKLFEEQVARTPDKIALTYEGDLLTYRELNEKADRLASYLHSISVRCEEPVALMAGDSLVVVVALLGILKAEGAYLPLNFEYPGERKKYILKDCEAKKLLTNYNFEEACDSVSTVVDLNDGNVYKSTKNFDKRHRSNNLAYIIYTSGSTGTAKGVMVEHKNVVRLVKNTNYIEFMEGDSVLLTGALEFDASTFEIWGPLLNGLTLHLVNKSTILNPDELKKAIRRSETTTMWMTSPLFNQMLDTDIEIFEGLKNLLVGGDVLSLAHINRVRKRFPGLKVINGYGPTENTTFSSTHLVDKEYQESIPIGKPISNSTAYIIDRCYHLVPINVAGELLVGGDGLARGYLNSQELTNEKFIPNPFGTGSPGNRERIYITGDLARWLPDGDMEFLGRTDHQVKIRGYRIEPGEIENHLIQLDLINEAVVVDIKNKDGEKYLCAYVVPAKGRMNELDVVEIRKVLSLSLPDYMVPTYFVPLETIPLTPNGKVDWRALPEPEPAGGTAAYAAPRNPVEEKFVEIWSELLKIEKEKIGIDSDFFELGGHSLKATVLISKLHKAFNVKVPLVELFLKPTIRELAQYMKSLTKDKFSPIKVAEKKEYYELSSAQERLYVLQQIELDSTVYNVPQSVVLEGELDLHRPEKTFKKLIKRHESLRTSFEMINEKPVQIIHDHDEVDFGIEYYDLATENAEGPIGSSPRGVRHFDLSRAPLLRVGLTKIEETKHLLMVDMHHIITDGTSLGIFVKEFMALYSGEDLPLLRLQYKDYSEWQNSKEQQELIKQQEAYWLTLFSHKNELPVLDLPTDFPRPVIQSFEGSSVYFQLKEKDTKNIKAIAKEVDATLYMCVLSVFYILLSKLCTQEDIVIGTPIAGRRHTDLEHIVGMFVNTLAIRNYPSGEKTFKEFLEEVKGQTLKAFENQDYQFEDLVDKILVRRDTGRNPLFDVMFVLEEMEVSKVDISELKLSPYEYENKISKFDLDLYGIDAGENLSFSFVYCTKLFKKETILRFIQYFKEILSSVIKDPGKKLSEIKLISKEEKDKIRSGIQNDMEEIYVEFDI